MHRRNWSILSIYLCSSSHCWHANGSFLTQVCKTGNNSHGTKISSAARKALVVSFLLSRKTKHAHCAQNLFSPALYLFICAKHAHHAWLCQWRLTVTVDSNAWSLESWSHSHNSRVNVNPEMQSIVTHDPDVLYSLSSSYSFLFVLRPYVKKMLSNSSFCSLLGKPPSSVLYMHAYYLALCFRCDHVKVQKYVVQGTVREIQRWISVLYSWVSL